MTAVNGKIFLILATVLTFAWSQQNFPPLSDYEVPLVTSRNAPYRMPDSLKSRPYFDFLSTLYRHDADKNQLFIPYARGRRDVDAGLQQQRSKRAIVFRPLFVYRQQEVRKQNQRRRRV